MTYESDLGLYPRRCATSWSDFVLLRFFKKDIYIAGWGSLGTLKHYYGNTLLPIYGYQEAKPLTLLSHAAKQRQKLCPTAPA